MIRPVPTILILPAALALLAAVSSCKRSGDSLDKLLMDRQKSGSGDQALTLLKENESAQPMPGGSSNRSLSIPSDEIEPVLVTNVPVSRPSTAKGKGPAAPVSSYTSVTDIKKFISLHQYDKVLAARIDPKSADSIYYSGNAHFVKALMTKGSTRDKLVAGAEKQFAAAGKLENDKTKKARAYLWLGITRYKFRAETYDLETVSQPLRYVVDKLPDTPYYNDALLYLGLSRAKQNLRDSAKDYFNLLHRTDSRDRVYDIDYQKWSTPQAAARHYLTLIGETRDNGTEAVLPIGSAGNATGVSPRDPASSPNTPSPVFRPQGVDSTRDSFLEKVERIHREILGSPMESRSNGNPGSGEATPPVTNRASVANARDRGDGELIETR